jgi:predicted nucleic acid-binding Zn ribbon protein
LVERDLDSYFFVVNLFIYIKNGLPMRNREKKEKQCLNCGSDIPNRNIYCNNKCQNEYQRKNIFKLLEENVFDGYTSIDSIHDISKKYLIYKYGESCMICGWCVKNKYTGISPIQINHIDGDPHNHSISNIELLCPNCHSLTEFFGRRGKGRKNRYKK